MSTYDICVQGQGIVGRAFALTAAAQGWRVAFVQAPQASSAPRARDLRAYALNLSSVQLLQDLKVWPALEAHAATRVTRMRVFGDAGGALEFSAWQQRVSDLTWIVDVAAIEDELEQAMRFAARIETVGAPVPASLLAICEGTHSTTREQLGAEYVRHPYHHHGVAARVVCDRPHRGVAWQQFRSPDILALLPFHDPQPGSSYALVWSLPVAQAERVMALSEADFVGELNAAVQAFPQRDLAASEAFGRIISSSERASWPLSLAKAKRWCGPGWVLLGDAAHQVHPLSGQGLNLGLGDVCALSECLLQLREQEPWRSVGDEKLLRRYARARWLPTQMMAGLTDGMLNLFSASLPGLAPLRNLGLSSVNRFGPLKRWLGERARIG